MKKLKYKAVYGYGNNMFISFDISLLPKVIYARLNKTDVIINGSIIDASKIISIEPDMHDYFGYNESYQITNKDKYEFKKDFPLIDETITEVTQLVQSKQLDKVPNLLSNKLQIKAPN